VVTGADVRVGKPNPQVFLVAASRLRIPPERCAVVEDAPLGIDAARAAGAAAIGLASTGRTRASLAAADLVVDRLDELTPERIADVILGRLEAGETA
jgi:beta-phosphoglucomutase-like phosphatase (HAD superfamily)